MAKCYRCDMCGVVTILRDPIDLDFPDYDEPAMIIYTKTKNYDICPNCASRVLNFIKLVPAKVGPFDDRKE